MKKQKNAKCSQLQKIYFAILFKRSRRGKGFGKKLRLYTFLRIKVLEQIVLQALHRPSPSHFLTDMTGFYSGEDFYDFIQK